MKRQVGDGVTDAAAALTREIGDLGRAARPGDRPEDRPEAGARPSISSALWDIDTLSAYLQVPVNSLYKMTGASAKSRIPHLRIGGRLRFRQADVDAWLSTLTSSNTDALARMRQRARKVTHGAD